MGTFFVGVLVGAGIGYFLCAFMTRSKQNWYEDKLWELEKKLWSAEHENK